MTKKIRLVLIAICTFIAGVCLLTAGCSLKQSLQEVLKDLNDAGAVVDVTYFANEGGFAGGAKITNMRCKAGNKAAKIAEDESAFPSGGISVTYTKHRLVGWYKAAIDPETGYPLYDDGSYYEFDYDIKDYDSTKNIQHTGELFDFNTKLEKGTHYYLVAEWEKVESVQVKLAGEVESINVTDLNGKEVTYNKNDLINDIKYEESNGEKVILSKPSEIIGTVKNATFIEFYYKATCEKEDIVTWPLYFSDHSEEDFTIYAKYIEGIWTVVRDRNGVERMFTLTSSSDRYYVFDNINCDTATEAQTPNPLEINLTNIGSISLGCEIQGNGFTVSGLKITASFSRNMMNSASFLGNILSSAKIRNIKFEVEEEYDVNNNATAYGGIYFAFTSIEAGAQIEDVEITGTMTVKHGATWNVKNLRDGAENNWKFGGYTNDSDYTGGITVNATLSVIDK